MTEQMNYVVYIIKSDNHTYIGMTNNFFRRWRQHNKIIKGGAKATSRRENWTPICIIDGFLTLKEACQCEWKLKRVKGHKKRVQNVYHHLMNEDKNATKLILPNISNESNYFKNLILNLEKIDEIGKI